MQDKTDVAIVGAGPYGLSIGTHLVASKMDMRIYGPPMATWRTAMPRGMKLKSEGFASNLYDPAGEYLLQRYCNDHHLPYRDIGLPVPVETFVDYGIEFQRRFLPQLDERKVVAIEHAGRGFELALADGSTVLARNVVVATGISNYEYIPPGLLTLPPTLLSHSSAHHDVRHAAGAAAGKQIIIVGAGASAIDLAALLDECGASVTVLARRQRIGWCGAPAPRSLLDRIREPASGLGTGWRSLMCVKAPLVFHGMPEEFRLLVVRKHLGPAPGWVPRERVEKHVSVRLGTTIAGVRAVGDRAVLTVNSEGHTYDLAADHVIAATGYRPDLRRLDFIGQSIRGRMRTVENTPILDRHMQSSIPGLYFTGISAANSFGPLMRFACGAEFAARRLVGKLRRAGKKTRIASAEPLSSRPVPGLG